jgi:hypothetical protein
MPNFIKDWTDNEVERVTRSFRRHSRFVFGLKFLLPLAIIAMVVAVFLYPMLTGKKEKKIVLVAHQQTQLEKNAKPEMENPRFHGMDSKNQPYNISAEKAVQIEVGVLTMYQINADITMNNGDFVGMVADSGTYHMTDQLVNLVGNVEIFVTGHDQKFYEVRTSNVDVDAKNGLITGASEVFVKSPMGEFEAASFKLNKIDGKISFNGPVKMTIQR